jgi:glycosyltransferase involved in cell wall biosynthesis
MDASVNRHRILYVWQAAYPWDVRVEKICASLVREGFEVELLARRGNEAEPRATESGFTIQRVGPGPEYRKLRALSLPVPGNPLWAHALRDRIKTFRPHLVIARDIPLALPTAAACRRARIPWVIDMAEHYPVAMRTWKKYQKNVLSRFAINQLHLPDRIERRSVALADGVLPVIEEMSDRLVHDYGCEKAKIVPVLNTPEKHRLPPRIEGARRAARFGYHGVVIQDRDLLTVIRGFDLAAAKHPDATLVIAGSGESDPDVKREVERARNGNRIELTGRFRPEQLPELYSAVDYGIVSWTVNDFTDNTIANKFFDYAAFGKPIIYAETRPMVRLMKSMKFGFGYSGGDPGSCAEAMHRLLEADYASLARSGRAAVEQEFNWDVDTKRMVSFLRSLIGQAAGGT